MQNPNRFSVNGRVVVITGATSGIGRAISIACATEGARVAAIGRDQTALMQLQEDLARCGGDGCKTYCFDVRNYDAIPELVAKIAAECGKINGFVHCAGLAMTIPLKMMNSEIYEQLFSVNVFAGYELARHIVNRKNFDQSCRGSLVFISSVSALGGESGLVGYSSSKGALLSGGKALAAELATRNIKVNTLTPGHIGDTRMGQQTFHDLPAEDVQNLQKAHRFGIGKTEDLIGPVLFLLSSASDWMTGSNLVVDGGYTL